ncbi:Cupredoxin [Fusarium redolens]|uniref:Cupredoxin n=1 Tax=Fusarium redolens TaxID=48865 RepID=A0A9P9GI46_FUSRE|nr:Cupredoxin [Fusarium redolens]KAH7239898.1 Cupredoxin [Fusarium redolens]
MQWQQIFVALYCALGTVSGFKHHVHDANFTPDEVLRVTRHNVTIGGLNRYTTLVNETSPGPEVRIIENRDNNLTMHWHGLSQSAYPFSDGIPLASQWPIPPGHYFDYELRTEVDTAGTYFYHSHIGFQASTAGGPLIVEDPGATSCDRNLERVFFLSEYWQETDQEVKEQMQDTPIRWPGKARGFLINGKGIASSGVLQRASKTLEVIEVEPAKAYRLRFIGVTSLFMAMIGVENHTQFDIIAADGHYMQPYTRLPEHSNLSKSLMILPPTISGYLDYNLRPLRHTNPPTINEVTRRTEDQADPVPHTSSSQPYLVALYNNQSRYLPDYDAAVANGGLDPKTGTYPAKLGEVIEIDGTPGGGGPGAWDPDVVEKRLNGIYPVLRDTTLLYRYQEGVKPNKKARWRVWRLRINDPGGMQTVWIYGDMKDIMHLKRPDVQGYLNYGGDIYGNATYAPIVVYFYKLS